MANTEIIIDELVLEKGISVQQVQREIDDIVAKLKDRNTEAMGSIDQKDYRASKGLGIGALETVIIAFVGALAKEIAATAWKDFIWPALQHRFGIKIKSKGEEAAD
jgi:hypothetical protein